MSDTLAPDCRERLAPAAGVIFVEENGGGAEEGPEVRLRTRSNR
jgi:hypothetical protein